MKRSALVDLKKWWGQPHPSKLLAKLSAQPLSQHLSQQSARKPLVLRGARQVGKSFLVRDFCKRENLHCLELNFEKEPSLKELFVEGDNSRTIALLEAHFRR